MSTEGSFNEDLEMNVSSSEYKIDVALPKKQKTLSFHDIKFSVNIKEKKEKVTKNILKGVSGVVQPGQLLAIMGPSGSGKTTLLDILAHRALPTSGSVVFDGVSIDSDKVRSLVGYVPQNDVLMPSLTVRETLIFYADLKLSHNVPKEKRIERADELIRDLHLERCQNTLIGNELLKGVSGGEKRRVSIAIELLSEPSVLFLDEPTSGLDSATSVSIMNLILDLAKGGRTVICTIHQPRSNIFASFDQLMLLVDGQTIYYGPSKQVLDHFADLGYECDNFTNPADFFIDIVTSYESEDTKANHERLVEHFEKSEHKKNLLKSLPEIRKKEKKSRKERKEENKQYAMATNYFQQFWALLWRNLINLKRDPTALRFQFIQMIASGLLIGIIFLRLDHSQTSPQSRTGVLAFVTIGFAFGQIIGVAQRFPSQKAIYLRDRQSKLYHTVSYYIATLSDFPFQVLLPVIQITIIYWMSNLNSGADNYFICVGFGILLFQVCLAGGIAISALAPSGEVALAMGPLVAVVWVLFSGFFINFDDLPIFFIWVPYISPVRYGLEALIYNEFSGAKFNCKDSERLESGRCPISTGEDVLKNLKMDDVNLGLNGGILILMWFVLHALGCLFLKMKDKSGTTKKATA